MPFLFLVGAGLWWAWLSLLGLAFVDKRRPRLPQAVELPESSTKEHTTAQVTRWVRLTEDATKSLVRTVQPGGSDGRVYAPALVSAVITLLAIDKTHPVLSLETNRYEWSFVICIGVATFAMLCTVFRILISWLECRKLLGTLDRFPFRRAFADLNFGWRSIWRLSGNNFQGSFRLVSRQLETLENLKKEVIKEGEVARAVVIAIQDTETQYFTLNERSALILRTQTNQREPAASNELIDGYRDLLVSIASATAQILAYLQHKWWGDEGLLVREVGSSSDDKTITVHCLGSDNKSDISLATRLAERFVALVYLNFVRAILLRLRTMAFTAAGIYVLLLISINSYPFEPRAALRSLAIVTLIIIVGVIAYVFAEVDRDSILSLVTQTKPGELGIEFWLRMGTFLTLPVLSLLVSQFPALNNALFSWLGPAANALK